MKIKTIILSITLGVLSLLMVQAEELLYRDWKDEIFNFNYTIENNTDSVLNIQFSTKSPYKEDDMGDPTPLFQRLALTGPDSIENVQIKSFGRGHSKFEFSVDGQKGRSGPIGVMLKVLPPLKEKGTLNNGIPYSIESTYDENSKTANFKLILGTKSEEL